MKKRAEGHPIYQHAHFFSIAEVGTLIEKAGMRIESYASTLLQLPADMPEEEAVHDRAVNGAGFVCLCARKED